MVSVAHALPAKGREREAFDLATRGLNASAQKKLLDAWTWAAEVYGDRTLGTGEPVLPHAQAMAVIAASLDLDLDTRVAALLFDFDGESIDHHDAIAERFGTTVVDLVAGLERLAPLRLLTRGSAGTAKQTEILRKMLLAMVEDIRVVVLRLASRAQTLRWLVSNESAAREEFAREGLDIYAPLANRLGIWQFKWEIEDLSLRLLEPATYKRIANMLDERRVERQSFIEEAVIRVKRELKKSGINAQVIGRPKHIFSIWTKMQAKHLDFDAIHDVRALRIIVDSVSDCYAALGVVHQMWSPIEGEFDDYIAQPKSNNYQSLHTALVVEDGRSLEVQIRTEGMNQHAELGIAAHWRYKESASVADSAYDSKIALLRQLLTWRDEVVDASARPEKFKRAALDDTIYVITPQGRVIDLPQGATALDFAYRLHTNLGHSCRGARADGKMWSLNRPLLSGQMIEITSVREGGPSRDWLGEKGYLMTSGARRKVQQWFTAQESAETIATGRAFITKALQREGQTQANLEGLAKKLGFRTVDAMFTAAGHDEIGPRQLRLALHAEDATAKPIAEVVTKRSRASKSPVLIVGVDKLMTQLGRCCKPAPPDVISGFVTRGRGVSIHRKECANFHHLVRRNPERVIAAAWGGETEGLYAIGLQVEAYDRKGLLRDISETLSREKISVTTVRSTSRRDGTVRMNFTVEMSAVALLPNVLSALTDVSGVYGAKRI